MKTFPFSISPRVPLLALVAGISAMPVASANEVLDVLEDRSRQSDEAVMAAAEGAPGEGRVKTVPLPPALAHGFLDPAWARAMFWNQPDHPWVQEMALTGMLQWNGSWGTAHPEGGTGVDVEGTRVRRARLGARLKMFRNTDVEAVGEFAGDSNYQGIERFKARTAITEATGVTYGKFRPEFSSAYSEEPRHALTPDRPFLVNMVAPAATLGIAVDHSVGQWDLGLGWFSSDNHPDFPGFEGNGFLLAKVAYESLPDEAGRRTRWHADYLYNFDEGKSSAIPRYNVAGMRSANGNQLIAANPQFRQMFSTGIAMEDERFAFASDFILADGAANVWGLTLTPSYWVLPGKVKLVGRYQFAGTSDAGGLVGGFGESSDLNFDSAPVFIGDEMHSFYLGANVHLLRDDVILMNGLERFILNDQKGGGFDTDGWIWHSGIRAAF